MTMGERTSGLEMTWIRKMSAIERLREEKPRHGQGLQLVRGAFGTRLRSGRKSREMSTSPFRERTKTAEIIAEGDKVPLREP